MREAQIYDGKSAEDDHHGEGPEPEGCKCHARVRVELQQSEQHERSQPRDDDDPAATHLRMRLSRPEREFTTRADVEAARQQNQAHASHAKARKCNTTHNSRHPHLDPDQHVPHALLFVQVMF